MVGPPACSHSHTLGNINERSRPDNFQRATLLSPLFVWKCLSSNVLCDVIGRSHLWLQPLMWRSETGTTSTAVRSRRCSNDCTAPSLYNMSATRNYIDCKHVFIKCFKSPDRVLNGLIHIFILVLSFVSWVSPLDQFSFLCFAVVFSSSKENQYFTFSVTVVENTSLLFLVHIVQPSRFHTSTCRNRNLLFFLI